MPSNVTPDVNRALALLTSATAVDSIPFEDLVSAVGLTQENAVDVLFGMGMLAGSLLSALASATGETVEDLLKNAALAAANGAFDV